MSRRVTRSEANASRAPPPTETVPPPTGRRSGRVLNLPNAHGIRFVRLEQVRSYNKLKKRNLKSTSFLDDALLQRLGLFDDLIALLDVLGWRGMMTGNWPVYEDLTYEFFSTLDVDFEKEGVEIKFRLGGQEFDWDLARFCRALGLPPGDDESAGDVPEIQNIWEEITHEARLYQASSSKGTYIRNPVIRYLQRLMACIPFGRETSRNVVEQEELKFIWAMLHGQSLETGRSILRHLFDVCEAKGAIVVGGLVTALAFEGGVDVSGRVPIHEAGRLNASLLKKMGVLVSENGIDKWQVNGDRSIALPNREYTCPRGENNLKMLHENLPQVPNRLQPHPQPHLNPARGSRYDLNLHVRVSRLEQEVRELRQLLQQQQQPPPPPH